jgi:hypothetical protein
MKLSHHAYHELTKPKINFISVTKWLLKDEDIYASVHTIS